MQPSDTGLPLLSFQAGDDVVVENEKMRAGGGDVETKTLLDAALVC